MRKRITLVMERDDSLIPFDSSSGSLTNLAKYPASTVQILGAEKALFRALKTKGNTPKYGLIYHRYGSILFFGFYNKY